MTELLDTMDNGGDFDEKNIVKDAYEKIKTIHGEDSFLHINNILEEIRPHFYEWWTKNKGMEKHLKSGLKGKELEDKIQQGVGQAWNKWKGDRFQELVEYVIRDFIEELGLKTCSDDDLKDPKSVEMERVRKNTLVRYGKEIDVLPDMDVVIYKPHSYEVVAILSCKTSLRERIAQCAYWKIKLSAYKTTEAIKYFLVSPDSDEIFRSSKPTSGQVKGRIITEFDTDGAFIMNQVITSEKIRPFKEFKNFLRKIVTKNGK